MMALPLWKVDIQEGCILWLREDANLQDPGAFADSKLTKQSLGHPVIIIDCLEDDSRHHERVKIVKCSSTNFKHGYKDLRISHYDKSGEPSPCSQCGSPHNKRARDMLLHRNKNIQMNKPTYVKTDEKFIVSLLMLRPLGTNGEPGSHQLDGRSRALLRKKAGLVVPPKATSLQKGSATQQSRQKTARDANVRATTFDQNELQKSEGTMSQKSVESAAEAEYDEVSGSAIVTELTTQLSQAYNVGGSSPDTGKSESTSSPGSSGSGASPTKNCSDSMNTELHQKKVSRHVCKINIFEEEANTLDQSPSKVRDESHHIRHDIAPEPEEPSPLIDVPAAQAGSVYLFDLGDYRKIAARYGTAVNPEYRAFANQKFIFSAMMPDMRASYYRIKELDKPNDDRHVFPLAQKGDPPYDPDLLHCEGGYILPPINVFCKLRLQVDVGTAKAIAPAFTKPLKNSDGTQYRLEPDSWRNLQWMHHCEELRQNNEFEFGDFE